MMAHGRDSRCLSRVSSTINLTFIVMTNLDSDNSKPDAIVSDLAKLYLK